MRAVRALFLRLAGVLGAGRRDREITEELAAHRDMLAAEYRRSGLNEDDARRAAAAEFGSVAAAAGAYRDRRGLPTLEGWIRDGLYAVRSLRRSPVLALSIVLVLGLGIGFSTALATVLHSIVWQALPVPEPDRVVRLALALEGKVSRHIQGQESWFSYPELTEYREATRALESVAGVDYENVQWRTDADVQPLAAGLVTADYFRALRVAPARGRLLTAADAQQPVVVISHHLWTGSLAGKPDVIGSVIVLDRYPYAIVGVAEERFSGTEAAPVDTWLPLETATRLRGDTGAMAERDFSWLQIIGRLAPGHSLNTATAEAAVIASHFDLADPGRHTTIGVTRASRLDPGLLKGHDRDMVVAAGAAAGIVMGILLLICGSNVAALLLARGATRQKEFALRIALGAGRGRVVQQLIAEVAVIAIGSALIGVLVCTLSLHAVASWLPIRELVGTLSPDLRIFGFALTLALGVSFVFGLAPVRQALQVDCLTGLKGDHGCTPAMRLRRWLVSVQVAVSLILLVTAALFTRGIEHTFRVDPGYSTTGLYIVQPDRASIPGGASTDLARFTEQLRRAIAQHSGVTVVGRTMTGPFWGTNTTQVRANIVEEPVSVHFGQADDNYFRALGVSLVAGRFVLSTESDAVLVNSRLARKFWSGDRTALEHVLRIPADASGAILRTVRVVGVVPTLQTSDVGVPDGPTYYLPVTAGDPGPGSLLVRAVEGTPVARLVAEAVQSLSPGTFAKVASVEDRMAIQTGPARIGAAIAGLLGVLGLLVAAVGLYGVVAHAVISRTREIGIHLALGAPPARLLHVILGSSVRGAVFGALAGGAVLATILLSFSSELRSVLLGLNPLDPVAFLVAGLALMMVILSAAYLPARRALRIGPTEALRHGT
jgi:predicted permease